MVFCISNSGFANPSQPGDFILTRISWMLVCVMRPELPRGERRQQSDLSPAPRAVFKGEIGLWSRRNRTLVPGFTSDSLSPSGKGGGVPVPGHSNAQPTPPLEIQTRSPARKLLRPGTVALRAAPTRSPQLRNPPESRFAFV